MSSNRINMQVPVFWFSCSVWVYSINFIWGEREGRFCTNFQASKTGSRISSTDARCNSVLGELA